jgi:hypothetical protein
MKKRIITFAFLVAVSFAANAQPGSTTTLGDPFGDEPVDVPVDGGISILAIASAAYGYKKLKAKK